MPYAPLPYPDEPTCRHADAATAIEAQAHATTVKGWSRFGRWPFREPSEPLDEALFASPAEGSDVV